jgi:hypothetical protein
MALAFEQWKHRIFSNQDHNESIRSLHTTLIENKLFALIISEQG